MKNPYRFQYHKTDQAPQYATIGVTISQHKEPDVCVECEATIPLGTEYVIPRYFDSEGPMFAHAPVVCIPCAIEKGWVSHDDHGEEIPAPRQ